MNSLGPKISQLLNAMHSIQNSPVLGAMAGRSLGMTNMRDLTQVVDNLANNLMTGFLSQSLGLGFESAGSPFFMAPPVRFVVISPFDFASFFSSDQFGTQSRGFKPYKLDFESPLPGYRRESSRPEPTSKNEPPVQPPSEPTLKEQLEKAGDELEGLSRQFDTRGLALTEIQNFRLASQNLVKAPDPSARLEAKAQVEKSIGKVMRILSLSVHPDKNPGVGSDTPFKDLTEIREKVLQLLDEIKV